MQVQEFIEGCIERAGGDVEVRAPNLLDVLLPPPLEERVGSALLALALDPEALSAEPQAELVTVGSPFLDALIGFAAQRGTTAVAHILTERLKKKGLREEVERALIFSHGRVRYDTAEPDILRCHYAQFHFKVTFLSEERRERLYVVPINLWSNQPNPLLAERLPTLALEETPSLDLLEAPRVSAEESYATARRALREQMGEEIARHQERIRKRFAVEFGRIRDYYAQAIQESQRRREREGDEGRAEALAQKIAAAEAERERKLRELGETYRLRLRARLTSVRLLSQPKTFFKLFLDRGQTTRTLTLAYDSVLERLEPPVCESCRRETTRIHVAPEARLLCPACAQ